MADHSDPSNAAAVRCFWAALPDRRSRRDLAAAVERLRAVAGADWRWIPPANWHLTLHFLGPTTAPQIAVLGAALDERPLPRPLVLAWRGIGPFPRARPRTLAALLQSCAALDDWVSFLRQRTLEAGLELDDRPFRAHLTVARPRRRRPPPHPELRLGGELCFDRVALMRSDLGPEGASYRPLAAQAAAPG